MPASLVFWQTPLKRVTENELLQLVTGVFSAGILSRVTVQLPGWPGFPFPRSPHTSPALILTLRKHNMRCLFQKPYSPIARKALLMNAKEETRKQ